MNKKKTKRRLILGFLVISIMVCYLGVFIYREWSMILANNNEAEELRERYEALLKEEDELNSEITKMQDADYVAKYAREKYGYSKEGEVIIKVED